jgi:hypothetical protein
MVVSHQAVDRCGDDRVVTIMSQRAIGKNSGVPVEWEMAQVYELDEDGRLVAKLRQPGRRP